MSKAEKTNKIDKVQEFFNDVSYFFREHRYDCAGAILVFGGAGLYDYDPFIFRVSLAGLVGLAIIIGLIFLVFKKPAVAIALFLLIIIMILLVK